MTTVAAVQVSSCPLLEQNGAVATTDRMLRLLSLLQSGRLWPGAALADRLGTSARTVRRDIERVRELGYRITAERGPEGGYRLEAGESLPPLLFDDDQAVVLAIALQSLVVSGSELEDAAARARSTVRQVLPPRLRPRLDALSAAVASAPSRTVPVQPELLAALAAAVHGSRTLRVGYGAAAADERPRRIEPHGLIARLGRWYLIAWDVGRDDWRVLRADRVALRGPAGAPFEPRLMPGGDAATMLEARMKGSSGEDAWPCRGSATICRPAHELAPYVGDGSVRPVDADRSRVELGAWSWPALAAALARFDADIDDVEPPPLAAAFGLLADRCARASRGSA